MKHIGRCYILMGLLLMMVPQAFAADGNAAAGKEIFSKVCAYCHAMDGSGRFGPSLAAVGERRSVAWLHGWLKNPREMIKNDVDAKVVRGKNKYNMTMPAIPAMQDAQKRADVIAYLLKSF